MPTRLVANDLNTVTLLGLVVGRAGDTAVARSGAAICGEGLKVIEMHTGHVVFAARPTTAIAGQLHRFTGRTREQPLTTTKIDDPAGRIDNDAPDIAVERGDQQLSVADSGSTIFMH